VIRKLILTITLSVILNANIDLKIKDILGDTDYNTHKNLINHIFSNKNAYYTNNQVDYTKLTQELSKNSLLKLDLGSTQNIEVIFNIKGTPKKSIRNLNEILKNLGHQFFITKEEIVVDDNLSWTIKLKTAAAISPLRLSQELQSINCNITDIKREGTYKWSYSIDMDNSTIYKAEDLIGNNQLSLKKSIKPYIIKVKNSSKIVINSNVGNNWYPNVVFYDEDFNIIKILQADSLHKSLKLDVPNNTKYIKIDDLYSLANIKRGINITKE